MTSSSTIRAGAEVKWLDGNKTRRGTVMAYREIGARYVATLKSEDGSTVVVALDEDNRLDLNSPVSKREAAKLARSIIAGAEPRIPVATQLNILALALLGEVEGGP